MWLFNLINLAAVYALLGLGVALLIALVSHPHNSWIVKYKTFIIAFILTLNSLSFSIHTSPEILDSSAILYGFPLFWLTRVLATLVWVNKFYLVLGGIMFILDFIFWLKITQFTSRFLRAKKLSLPRNTLALGIFGIIVFALASYRIVFWRWVYIWQAYLRPWGWSRSWQVLLGDILYLAGLSYIFYMLSRVKKLPLPRNTLILGILGFMISTWESYMVAQPVGNWDFFWEVLLGVIPMLSGFFYIISIVIFGEERSTLALVNKNAQVRAMAGEDLERDVAGD